MVTENKLFEKFINCAICCGYCIDSGRAQFADEISPDLLNFQKKILAAGRAGLSFLTDLLEPNNAPWVRHYAAQLLLQDFPDEATKTLNALRKMDGFVALNSEAVLGLHSKDASERNGAQPSSNR